MTSTNETVINFTMKELGEKIRRAMMRMFVTYRRQNELEFPILKRREAKYSSTFDLPSNIDIRQAIERARVAAMHHLEEVGISEDEQRFEGSLDSISSMDFEFVSVECSTRTSLGSK